jgi:hypothetical protein
MDVECTGCGTVMSRTRGAGNNVYYSCPRCARTIASVFDEAIRRRAGVRPVVPPPPPRPRTALDDRYDEAKARLDAWMRRLDDADPYHVLGVRPGAPLERVRARYHELAMFHHPDRGGDPVQMRRIARAYETLRERLAPAAPAPTTPAIPAPVAAPVLCRPAASGTTPISRSRGRAR